MLFTPTQRSALLSLLRMPDSKRPEAVASIWASRLASQRGLLPGAVRPQSQGVHECGGGLTRSSQQAGRTPRMVSPTQACVEAFRSTPERLRQCEPGRGPIDLCPWGSTGGASHWCSRSSHAAMGCADHRSRRAGLKRQTRQRAARSYRGANEGVFTDPSRYPDSGRVAKRTTATVSESAPGTNGDDAAHNRNDTQSETPPT
jgi:hypothetical protein